MKKILLILCAFFLSGALVQAATLDFEDALGTRWNGSLYGEPIYGPGEAETYYHGFCFEGWRVYNKQGALNVYGANSYIYQGTFGTQSLGRTSFDPKYITRDEDFYFNGATLTTTDYESAYPIVIEMIGYNDGDQVWYETINFSNNDNMPEIKDFTSSFSSIAVDSVRFHAWEYYLSSFVLDDFDYSELTPPGPGPGPGPAPVPEPATFCLFGAGLFGLAAFLRRKRGE